MVYNKYDFLSFVFSPTTAAILSTIVFSLFSPIGLGNTDILSSMLIGAAFLTLAPVFIVYYFERDFDIEDRKRRSKPYLITIMSFLACSVIFWLLDSKAMFMLSLSYLLVTSAIAVINMFWKISAHSSGMAGPTTALVYVFGPSLAPLYLLTLMIVLIRLKAKAHDILQLVAGVLVAILITLAVYLTLW
ncbi:MAG: hypothetical protein V1818_04160 [Candidatus Aenigmatarchaeota archaeon]